jgi:hypothetical protein
MFDFLYLSIGMYIDLSKVYNYCFYYTYLLGVSFLETTFHTLYISNYW